MTHERAAVVLSGAVEEQVDAAVRELEGRGALTDGLHDVLDAAPSRPGAEPARREDGPTILVLAEGGRPDVTGELIGAAARLGGETGAAVHVLSTGGVDDQRLAAAGADVVVGFEGSTVAEDVAAGVSAYVHDRHPWALLAPSTAFGREVAGRVAAGTGSGMVGDAVGLSVRDGALVAAKPAFAGALVADITWQGGTQIVTVRPGVLPASADLGRVLTRVTRRLHRRGRVRILAERRDDDVETLARAAVVIGVGTGVAPGEYEQLSPLAALLGAELAATRKVTDRGWAPRARQVGLTGRSIAPRLYVALGLSGKFNHIVGVRSAGTILAVNEERSAPVFGHCDVGIVADWHEAVPLLCAALRRRAAREWDEAPVS